VNILRAPEGGNDVGIRKGKPSTVGHSKCGNVGSISFKGMNIQYVRGMFSCADEDLTMNRIQRAPLSV
jgi:hypothetical protein